MSKIESKIHLLYVIDSQTVGGAEKHLLDLSRKMVRRYDVTIICPQNSGLTKWISEIQKYGIHIIRTRIHHIFDIWNIIYFLWLLRTTMIVHFILTCPSSNRLAIICAKLIGVPIRIATVQLVVPPTFRNKIRNLYTLFSIKFVYSFLHQIITVSRYSKRQLVKIYKTAEKKIKVIYNAIEIKSYLSPLGELEDEIKKVFVNNLLYIVVVGRLHPQKGHRYLINAAPKILSAYPGCHFVFIGDGEEKNQLAYLIDQKGLSNNFTFVGFYNQINYILHHIDLLVLPSLSEGFPIVILEAMAAGKPVVAFNVGGAAESIEDSITGILVSPQNINDLADSIIFLLRNKRIAQKMGRMGQERVKKLFSLNKMIAKTNQVYQLFLEKYVK